MDNLSSGGEPVACNWCDEPQALCKCEETCNDCGTELSTSEMKDNKEAGYGKQPLCDWCVWSLKH